MSEKTLPLAIPDSHESPDSRLPVWMCAAFILGVSAGCYWLLYRLIEALGFW